MILGNTVPSKHHMRQWRLLQAYYSCILEQFLESTG